MTRDNDGYGDLVSCRYSVTIGEASLDAVIRLTAKYFDAATITPGVGLWHGKQEPSTTVVIIGPETFAPAIHRFAKIVAHFFNQDFVLVETSTVYARFVDSTGRVTVVE